MRRFTIAITTLISVYDNTLHIFFLSSCHSAIFFTFLLSFFSFKLFTTDSQNSSSSSITSTDDVLKSPSDIFRMEVARFAQTATSTNHKKGKEKQPQS